jgi:hypothetical protein
MAARHCSGTRIEVPPLRSDEFGQGAMRHFRRSPLRKRASSIFSSPTNARPTSPFSPHQTFRKSAADLATGFKNRRQEMHSIASNGAPTPKPPDIRSKRSAVLGNKVGLHSRVFVPVGQGLSPVHEGRPGRQKGGRREHPFPGGKQGSFRGRPRVAQAIQENFGEVD